MPTQFTLKLTGGPTRRLSFTDEPTSSLLAEGIAGLFDIPADPIANFRIHDETTSISDSDSHVSTVMPPRVDKGKGRAKDIDASSTASLVEEKTFEKPDIHVVDVTAHEVTPPLPRLSRRSSLGCAENIPAPPRPSTPQSIPTTTSQTDARDSSSPQAHLSSQTPFPQSSTSPSSPHPKHLFPSASLLPSQWRDEITMELVVHFERMSPCLRSRSVARR
ncbi:hypothetical protein C8R42DRAFT_729967 [Lentinula raphanica]|nr:hypothetical protein C8R42DRAFT_729967 [Lentinula raphanica]